MYITCSCHLIHIGYRTSFCSTYGIFVQACEEVLSVICHQVHLFTSRSDLSSFWPLLYRTQLHSHFHHAVVIHAPPPKRQPRVTVNAHNRVLDVHIYISTRVNVDVEHKKRGKE
uniref:Uncharacterized protein n=1 Tax=Trypanosoma vivax (strain Y486) TaxID=1055687 RepID=G0TTD2_TRYVY|nr:conserved hypothetical protein [Trypanosoma vivax Y486]